LKPLHQLSLHVDRGEVVLDTWRFLQVAARSADGGGLLVEPAGRTERITGPLPQPKAKARKDGEKRPDGDDDDDEQCGADSEKEGESDLCPDSEGVLDTDVESDPQPYESSSDEDLKKPSAKKFKAAPPAAAAA